MPALFDTIDDIAAKAWGEVKNTPKTADSFVDVVEYAIPDEYTAPAKINDLPYFRFLKWMTVRALRRVHEGLTTLRTGGRGCIIQTAYGPVANYIQDGLQAARLASGDWDFNRKNAEAASIFGDGPREADVLWLPDTFDSRDAQKAAGAMIAWNDSKIYDDEKRLLLHAALDQEFGRRGLKPPCY